MSDRCRILVLQESLPNLTIYANGTTLISTSNLVDWTEPIVFGWSPAEIHGVTLAAGGWLLGSSFGRLVRAYDRTMISRISYNVFGTDYGEDVKTIVYEPVSGNTIFAGNQQPGQYGVGYLDAATAGINMVTLPTGFTTLQSSNNVITTDGNGAVVCAGISDGINKTTTSLDGGATWSTPIAVSGFTNNLSGILHTATGALLAWNAGGIARRSTDNGATWTAIASLPSFIVLLVQGNGIVAAFSGPDSVVYSDNNGSSWTTISTIPFIWGKNLYYHPIHGWLAQDDDGELYNSPDLITWNLVTTGLPRYSAMAFIGL